jgi:alpha-L-arabinofuranosidase
VPDSAPTLRFQAAWNGDKTTLILVVLNMSAETRTLTADLSRLDRRFAKEASGEALSAASPFVFNTETEPNRIARETFSVPNKGNRLTHAFKPWSATAIRLGSE